VIFQSWPQNNTTFQFFYYFSGNLISPLVSRLKVYHFGATEKTAFFIGYQVCIFTTNNCGDTAFKVQAVFFGPQRLWFSRPKFSPWQLDPQARFSLEICCKQDCGKCKWCANFHSKIFKTHCTVWFQVEVQLQGTVAGLLILLTPTCICFHPRHSLFNHLWESSDLNCSLLLQGNFWLVHLSLDLG